MPVCTLPLSHKPNWAINNRPTGASRGIRRRVATMLCSGKSAVKHTEEYARSREISRTLRQDGSRFRATQRLLLLGEGESGKSTIVKQMRILHTPGFTDEERKEKIIYIKRNIKDSMLTIIGAMTNIEPPVQLADPNNEFRLQYLLQETIQPDFDYPPIFFEHVQVLWNDAGIQECYRRSHEYRLMDCARYFFDRIPAIKEPDYMPCDQDIIQCRVLTSGVHETRFSVDDVDFHIFDVGGQRGERRKWIQCFGDTSKDKSDNTRVPSNSSVIRAILFVSAVSSYDLALREDVTKNNLQESLDVFKFVCDNKFLQRTSVIVFLNKVDLLEQKLRVSRTRIETYFPEFADYQPEDYAVQWYTHEAEAADEDRELVRAKLFFFQEFMRIAADCKRQRYAHFTCAIDTENVRRVFYDVRDTIQRINLRDSIVA